MESNSSNTKKINWKGLLIPLVIGVVYLIISTWQTISNRIGQVGWRDFPASMFDWFGITGGLILMLVVASGIVGIVNIVRAESILDS